MLPSHWLGNHRSCKEAHLSISALYMEHRRHPQPFSKLQLFTSSQVRWCWYSYYTSHTVLVLLYPQQRAENILKAAKFLGRLSRFSGSVSSYQGCVSKVLHNGEGCPAPERCLTAHGPPNRKGFPLGIRTSSKIDTMSTGKASDCETVSQRHTNHNNAAVTLDSSSNFSSSGPTTLRNSSSFRHSKS